MRDLVDRLSQLIVEDNAILFVDMSLCHRAKQSPPTQQIAKTLAEQLREPSADQTLPAVAQAYKDAYGKQRLISVVQRQLTELRSQVASLYQRVADIALLHTKIITTQLDPILEAIFDHLGKKYSTLTPDAPVSFFDETRITLIKMQGDINRPESVVLTKDDILEFSGNLTSSISDVVRALFATKTLIFLGHDLNNDLFQYFYHQVVKPLSRLHRRSYALITAPMGDATRHSWFDKGLEVYVCDPLAVLNKLAQEIKTKSATPSPMLGDDAWLDEKLILPDRPYKALESFSNADGAIFAGRIEESHQLANRILAYPLTVCYGESGCGKTSLLQAGVSRLLAKQGLPLAVCPLTAGTPLEDQIRNSLNRLDWPQMPVASSRDTLHTLIRTWQSTLQGPLVLAIDQFEQIFSPELSLVERQTMVEDLSRLLNDASLNLRLVLVIRQDFLGQLGSLVRDIPNSLDKRFRLERLTRETARLAIEEPARRFGITWEAALVTKLLDELYEGETGGVGPPQLQITCDYLYEHVAKPMLADSHAGLVEISLAKFDDIGGTKAILGQYLDKKVAEFPEGQQTKVRTLLGAFISSAKIKQRRSLEELIQITQYDPAETMFILDQLTELRLLQRFNTPNGTKRTGTFLEYELTHDYLVTQIVDWLGDEFWQQQRAREIVKAAVDDWREEGRLLSPDDLRLITLYCHQIGFTDEEKEMVYAAAASYDNQPEIWQIQLRPATTRRILLQLLQQHQEAFARYRAILHLKQFPKAEVALALAEAALRKDEDNQIRVAAAEAIAYLTGPAARGIGRLAINRLVQATKLPNNQMAARRALVIIRDQEPASHKYLRDLGSSIRRQVRRARWRRHWPTIWRKTLRGAFGGFLGGMGMIGLFLTEGIMSNSWETILTSIILGLLVMGVLGALSVSSGVFTGITCCSLQDDPRPIHIWLVVTSVTVLCLSLFYLLFAILTMGGDRSPLETLSAGILLGLGLTVVATAPLKIGQALQLSLTVLVSMATFFFVSWFILSGGLSLWILLLGAVAGLCFYWALSPEVVNELAVS